MTEYKRNPRGAKKASKELRRGDTLYTIVEVSQRHAPYEDSHLLHKHEVTGTHPLLGGAMVGGHSVEGIILREGPAYTTRPAGYRGVWEPAPQVPGPLAGVSKTRALTKNELSMLEARVARDLAGRYGRAKAKKVAEKLVAEHLAGAR